MRNSPAWWIFIIVMVAVDIYFFQALKVVTHSATPRTRSIIHSGYWVISVSVLVLLALLPYLHIEKLGKLTRTTLFALMAGLFFAKLVACFFFLVDDIRRGIQWLISRFSKPANTGEVSVIENGISRSVFLSWVGMIAGSGLFGTLVYGFGNKYRYRIRRQKIPFANLPSSFKGLRIVQISDIHSGSFANKNAVLKGVRKINDAKPDLVLFTGDLVNNVADEMEEYMDVFSQVNAPMGVYSILGNHDYGDYVSWPSKTEKQANLEHLMGIHKRLGWNLMMNENVVFERNGEKIALLGVENWSAKARFPKHGDLKKAHLGTESIPFKMLMSHDPSHWKAEVCDKYPDIDLVFSGHTHGMQFGLELPGFKWSPVKYIYHEWAGLYEHGHQKLYVNRGFGFLGYPGRVGILPEITVLELV